jgi:Ca-activated chloride channel homolog
MNFSNIHMLYLIWLLPVLLLVIVYGRRKRYRILSRYADVRMLSVLVPPGLTGRRRLKAALVMAAAWLLIMAMAGPRFGYEWQEFDRRGVDLIIALDCSRSMLAEDIAPTRLDRAKREIVDLLGMLEGDRIGLVAFSGSAFLQCPLTLDYSAFDLFLNVLTPDYMPLGGTDLDAAVRMAISAFDPESRADKAIILITDGEHTGRGDPQQAAEAALKAGIKLFCIGVGATQGVPVPAAGGGFAKDGTGRIVLSRLDESTLTRMAVATGGAYVRSVIGDMDLDMIYREGIRGAMDHATLESGRRKVWAERYQWPLLPAIVLLLAAQALPSVKKTPLALLIAFAALMQGVPGHAGPLQDGYKAYHQGRYEEALRHFVAGQLKDPENPEVLYNIGNAYYKIGDYIAAGAHYSQALSKAPVQLKSKILYNQGNTAYRLGKLQEAVGHYEAALELSPDDAQARENLEFVRNQLQQRELRQDGEGGAPGGKRPDTANDRDAGQKPSTRGDGEASDDPRQTQHDHDPHGKVGAAPDEPLKEGVGEHILNPPEGQGPVEHQRQGREPIIPPGGPTVHMLNRLKDEPGRAMMPGYGRQPVDRDW